MFGRLLKRLRNAKHTPADAPTSGSSPDGENLAVAADVMRRAIAVMSSFPRGFVPQETTVPYDQSKWNEGISLDKLLAEPKVAVWLQRAIDQWPKGLFSTFVEATTIIAQVLAMFGATRPASPFDVLNRGMTDPQTLEMMLQWGQVHRETKDFDMMGAGDAMLGELMRRGAEHRTPFARILTTLLGSDALQWLFAPSHQGLSKLQPHEFSRIGWQQLRAIETQIAIERELTNVPSAAAASAKIVVALAWTAAALASFMDPAIFLGERISYLSSIREGGQYKYTVTSGHGAETLTAFETSSVISMVRILSAALANPLLTAADLMWIGNSVVRRRRIEDEISESGETIDARCDLFLSHRGRDAKRVLASIVQTMPRDHGIFLDCLTLPRGVINRSFVYASLAASRRVLVVDTEHFNESEWCRKEAWLATALAEQGLLETESVALSRATEMVADVGPASRRARVRRSHGYPVTQRILKDLDYWGARQTCTVSKRVAIRQNAFLRLTAFWSR